MANSRKSFVFSDDMSARLNRLRVMTRGMTTTRIVMLALQVLWDVIRQITLGGQITFVQNGSRVEYNPFISEDAKNILSQSVETEPKNKGSP